MWKIADQWHGKWRRSKEFRKDTGDKENWKYCKHKDLLETSDLKDAENSTLENWLIEKARKIKKGCKRETGKKGDIKIQVSRQEKN